METRRSQLPPYRRTDLPPIEMPTIAALLESRAALTALRRSLPKGGPKVVSCRSPAALQRLLETKLIEAIVLTPQPPLMAELVRWRGRVPLAPLVAYAPFRPDDGELLLTCRRAVSAVAVEGVDDPVVGELVLRASFTAGRRQALAEAPRILRLTEPIQRSAWNLLVSDVERPMRTGVLAGKLHISREHLSRQFGAGGAPNLKRVIDLTRIACAAQLLGSPGYNIGAVVRVLNFASARHLATTSRRIANVLPEELGVVGPGGVLAGFVRGNTRSRVRA
jgi:AraC-like DNA-binding protein